MPILEPNDYWQLRALSADLEREQMLAQTRIEAIRIRRENLWKVLVEKYSLDSGKTYTARDEDCSLTPGNSV